MATKKKPQETEKSETRISESIAALAQPIADLIEDADNVRMHEPKSITAIETSLRRFGQVKPIVVDHRGVVIAGNGTLRAARNLGWDRLAVARFNGTKEEAKAYAIADNRTAELSHWDLEALKGQIRDLQSTDLLNCVGWSDRDLKLLLKEENSKIEVDVNGHVREIDTAPKMDPNVLYMVIVEGLGEQQQIELIEYCESKNYKCKGVMI